MKVHGNGKFEIGNRVTINSSEISNPIGGMEHTILVSYGTISIGDDTGISNSAIVAHDRITIGKRVKLGGNVKIYDTDFHSISYKKRLSSIDDDTKTMPVVIEDDVFVGAHCIILKGVKIGRGSVIGAGSVVTKDIPPLAIAAGNPAKVIRNIEDNC